MCTLSFRLTEQGYELLFNRDEQRSRARALPPTYDPEADATYPRDPDGGGTWIALHRSGMSLCLLNFYDGNHAPVPNALSRGGLIPQLLRAGSSAPQRLFDMSLASYKPFSLCYFPASLSAHHGDVLTVRWDGRRLSEQASTSPLTSSSVGTDLVQQARVARYRSTCPAAPSTSDLLRFHRSHWPTRSMHSVCMHREDATTVSMTQIVVGAERELVYYDGPPCSHTQVSSPKVAPAPELASRTP